MGSRNGWSRDQRRKTAKESRGRPNAGQSTSKGLRWNQLDGIVELVRKETGMLTPLKAIRKTCSDCSGQSAKYVTLLPVRRPALHPL